MYDEAFRAFNEALAQTGIEFVIQRGNHNSTATAIRNRKEHHLSFPPNVDVQAGDQAINTVSQEVLYIIDTETSIVDGKVLSLRASYETESEHKQRTISSNTVEKQITVLRAIQQLQGSSSDLIEDTAIAQRLSSDLQLVRDILQLLSSEGKIIASPSHGGEIDAGLSAKGRLFLADPQYHYHDSSSTTLNFSGNFQGAILNVQATLASVTQTIQSAANLEQQEKEDLQSLVNELLKELEKAPPENAEDVEAIAEAAKALMDASTKAKPNKKTIKITAEGLKEAAKNLAGILPEVVRTATEIATRIQSIAN